jgi:ABC-type oligopeptide transport system ATPase subunit
LALTDTLKVAISGTSGIGKSTLAEMLGGRLSLPVIDEHYDGNITRTKDKSVERWEKEMIAVLRKKHHLESQHDAFVTDRCPLDLFNGWLNNALHIRLEEDQTRKFLDACIKASRRYDFVVIPPWKGIPFNEREPGRDGVRRNNNLYVLLRSQASTLGLAHIFLDKRRIIEIPVRIKGRDERVDFVVKNIERRQTRFWPESGASAQQNNPQSP